MNTRESPIQSQTVLNGLVWYDENADGARSNEERGMTGIAVTLYRTNSEHATPTEESTAVTTVSTDATGHYQFRELVTGHYYVAVTIPHPCFVSPANVGENDAVDSDIDPNTGHTVIFEVDQHQRVIYQDAGLYSSVVPRAHLANTTSQIYLPMIAGGG